MTLLYNYEKQRIDNVPEEEVTNLVASGVYAPRKGVKIPVIAPDGEVGSIPSENAQSAFLQGFKYQTAADSRARAEAGIEAARQKAFGESTATAVAAGALRGATFGLSDVAMRAIGGEQAAEGLLETRERQPIASTVGEIGGSLAGLAVPVSPVAGVAKLGEKVAKGVATTERVGALAAKGTAGEIAAEILAKGAGSAVEGAFYGAGELLTEAALGDPNLTAQNAAVVFGANALLGGAVGGLVPGAATAAAHAKEKLGSILINDMNVPSKAMKAYGDLISFLRVSDPGQKEALKELAEPTAAGRGFREKWMEYVNNPDRAGREIATVMSEMADVAKFENDAANAIRSGARERISGIEVSPFEAKELTSNIVSALDATYKETTGKAPKRFRDIVAAEKEANSAYQKAKSALDKVTQETSGIEAELAAKRNELTELSQQWERAGAFERKAGKPDRIGKLETEISALDTKLQRFDVDALRKSADDAEAHLAVTRAQKEGIPSGLTTSKTAEDLESFAGGTAKNIRLASDRFREALASTKSAADLHENLWMLRKDLDAAASKYRGAEKLSPEAKNTMEVVNSLRAKVQEALGDEKIFGQFGKDFRETDAAFSKFIDAQKFFSSKFEEKTLGGKKEVTRGKAEGLIKSPTSAMAEMKQEAFDHLTNAVDGLNATVARLAESPTASEQLGRTISELRERVDRVKKVRAAAVGIDRLEAKTGRIVQAAIVGGALGEFGFDEIPGAKYAGALGGALLANPKTVMMYLSRLERGNMKAANAIEEASRKYLGAKVPASVSGALGAVWSGRKQGISELSRSLERDEQEQHLDDHDLIKTRLTPMQKIDHLDDVVKNQNPLLDDIAPGVYAETVNARQRAVSFLKAKFPADSDALFAGKSVLSASQKIKLDRYTAAAMNPSELLHEMAEGDVRPETVEAVRAVYPDVYAQIQQSITETLADPKLQRSLSYKKKQELSKVLGIPTTESLQNIDMLQQAWKIVPEENPSQVRPKAAASFQAPSEAVQSRMGS